MYPWPAPYSSLEHVILTPERPGIGSPNAPPPLVRTTLRTMSASGSGVNLGHDWSRP